MHSASGEGAVACGQCQPQTPEFSATYAPFLYDLPCDYMVKSLKFAKRLVYARVIAELMAERRPEACAKTLGTLLPVPLHRHRLGQRGFNQAEEITRHLSQLCDLPWRCDLAERHKNTRPQSSLGPQARASNLRDAFCISAEDLPERVTLVDDVMTSGATHNSLAKTLRRAGVREVRVWVFARTASALTRR